MVSVRANYGWFGMGKGDHEPVCVSRTWLLVPIPWRHRKCIFNCLFDLVWSNVFIVSSYISDEIGSPDGRKPSSISVFSRTA